MKRAQGRRPCAARPARADVMHLAGTCHTHPSTLLPRQMRAQTARTCESYHVCPGGERAQVPQQHTGLAAASCRCAAVFRTMSCLRVCHRTSVHVRARSQMRHVCRHVCGLVLCMNRVVVCCEL